jgi:hypothetical protein
MSHATAPDDLDLCRALREYILADELRPAIFALRGEDANRFLNLLQEV